MAETGQVIEGTGGMTLRLVQTAADTGGELLEMEATYPAAADLPPEHLHPKQSEHFEVLEGSIRAVIDGEELTFASGESFDVPVGTPHQMAAQDGPTRMRWEVRPALRTAEFFERLYGALREDDFEQVGQIIPEFSDEVSFGQSGAGS